MNNLMQVKETMSSLQIAEITGKPHNDVLKAIRAMEQAWVSVAGGKFSLSEYKDSTGRTLPCYKLNKTECLYVSTKFNDEARAKLVLRWEELETKKRANLPKTFAEALRLAADQQEKIEEQHKLIEVKDIQIEELKPKASYYDEVLRSKNAMNITTIAKDYGMSGKAMNAMLHELGVQYKTSDAWLPYQKYAAKGYTKTETITIKDSPTGRVSINTKWTQKGRLFLYELLKNNGVLPIMEQLDLTA